MRAWRITTAAHTAFDGEGARIHGSRWTPQGRRAVFASATLSLAALERFVHAEPDLEPDSLVAIAVDIHRGVVIEEVAADDLPADWRTYPPPPELTRFGERWLQESRTAVLAVPSAVIPIERNFVLNPLHPAFAAITILPPEPFSFDPRMWRRRR